MSDLWRLYIERGRLGVKRDTRIAELTRENAHLVLKLLFIEEWFDNILPNDWDLCMKRWDERSKR